MATKFSHHLESTVEDMVVRLTILDEGRQTPEYYAQMAREFALCKFALKMAQACLAQTLSLEDHEIESAETIAVD